MVTCDGCGANIEDDDDYHEVRTENHDNIAVFCWKCTCKLLYDGRLTDSFEMTWRITNDS